MNYKYYTEQMRRLSHTPMSEAEFNKMENISDEPIIEPLKIRVKNQRERDATHDNYVVVEK